MIADADAIVFYKHGVKLPVKVTAYRPEFTQEFDDTRAGVRLLAPISLGFRGEAGPIDGNKLVLLTGRLQPQVYTKSSILGQLIDRLQQRFGNRIEVSVAHDGLDGREPAASGDIGIRIALHPIPDGCTAANFTGAVRQSLRDIAQRMQPRAYGRAS